MNLNVNKFLEYLKKSTLNYSIESTSINFNDGKVWSKMMSPDQNAVIFLNMENNIITDVSDDTTFNFSEPNKNVKPYLDLIDNDEISYKLDSDKLTLIDGRQKSKLFFCVEDFVSSFGAEEPELEFFHELDLTNDVISIFNKVKKIASKFDKIYFTVEDNSLYIEATDKTNRYSNGLKYKLDDVTFKDIELCFEYKNINSVLNIITSDEFKLKFVYREEQNAGMILFEKVDLSEKYFLMSKME